MNGNPFTPARAPCPVVLPTTPSKMIASVNTALTHAKPLFRAMAVPSSLIEYKNDLTRFCGQVRREDHRAALPAGWARSEARRVSSGAGGGRMTVSLPVSTVSDDAGLAELRDPGRP